MRGRLSRRGGRLAIGALAVMAIAGRGRASQAPSVEQARQMVSQIVALPGGVVLVANGLGEVAETRDGGKRWRPWHEHVEELAVSRGAQLWSHASDYGFRGPRAPEVKRSADGGRTWTRRGIAVPKEDSAARTARLPARFLNAADGEPLLLTRDLQLWRPDPTKPVEEWSKVGVPAPRAERSGGGSWRGDAIEHQGAYYVVDGGSSFLSTDGARTWSAQPLPRFSRARLRCRDQTCFLLLDRAPLDGPALFRARVGRNDWKELGALAADAAAALAPIGDKRPRGSLVEARDLVVADDGLYLPLVVHPGEGAWGAVLRVDAQGHLQAVGGALDGELWVIARDSDGTLWVGGADGAFRLRDRIWARVWPRDRSGR